MTTIRPRALIKTAFQVSGLVALVVILAAVLMGAIVVTAKYLEKTDLPELISSLLPSATNEPPPPPGDEGHSTVATPAANPYALADWPDSPARRPRLRSVEKSVAPGGGNAGAGGPVGVSVDQFRTAVAEGKRVFLPAPKGECQLSGQGASASLNDLDSCLAAQASR